MSFLAPLFLLGALAIALPIIFHLFRRSSRERMPFSSLMFIVPTPPRITRRSRLEHILLLLLRCFVLVMLAAAFARPFFKQHTDLPITKTEIKELIFLVDTSASMRRDDLWSAARNRLAQLLRELNPSDRAAVLTFDRNLHHIVGFEQWASMDPGERAALTLQQIDKLSPSWLGTHLGTALTSAAELFEEGNRDASFGPRQIILISDLQEGMHLEGLQGYEWPRGVSLVLEPIKSARPTNGSLQLVYEADEGFAPSTNAGPRIRVYNSADAKREQFQVCWAGTDKKIDVYVPPGQSRAVQTPNPPSSSSGYQLGVSGDDQDFDNTLFYVPPSADVTRVGYVGNETETETTQPLYYLKRAFQQTRRQTVQLDLFSNQTNLTLQALTGIPLLIISDTLPAPSEDAAKQYLAEGHNILFIVKNASVIGTLSRLAGANSLQAEEVTPRRYAMFGEIKFDHPLFAPFADPRFSDFTKIHFWKYRRLMGEPLNSAQVIARFDSGDPALVQFTVGKGALFVLTSGWQPSDSQLALSSKFVPMLYSLLEQSGGSASQTVQYRVGDVVSFPVTNAIASIRKPDGSQVAWPTASPFAQTDVPGIYELVTGNSTQLFAVNLDPSESKTSSLAQEELERLGLPLHVDQTVSPKKIEETRRQLLAAELEKQQQLWRWLVLAAFIFLLIETILAARSSRHAVPVSA